MSGFLNWPDTLPKSLVALSKWISNLLTGNLRFITLLFKTVGAVVGLLMIQRTGRPATASTSIFAIEVGGDGANGMGHFLFQGKPQHNNPNGCKLRVDQKM